jgi:putative Holliday junction resolvase
MEARRCVLLSGTLLIYAILFCILSSSIAWVAKTPSKRITPTRRSSSIPRHSQRQLQELLLESDMLDAVVEAVQNNTLMGKIKSLGVDYGLSRTGLAVTVGFDPTPLTIVSSNVTSEVIRQVVSYSQSNNVDQVILGLPLHKNGTEAEQTNITRFFGNELAKEVLRNLGPDVPVLLWDERYTSKEAAARAHSLNPGRWLYGTLDAEAACIILEHYYYDKGQGAERVELEDDIYQECLVDYLRLQRAEEERKRSILDQREANLLRRKEAMERDRRLEEEMRTSGALGVSRKAKRKKKKKK